MVTQASSLLESSTAFTVPEYWPYTCIYIYIYIGVMLVEDLIIIIIYLYIYSGFKHNFHVLSRSIILGY